MLMLCSLLASQIHCSAATVIRMGTIKQFAEGVLDELIWLSAL